MFWVLLRFEASFSLCQVRPACQARLSLSFLYKMNGLVENIRYIYIHMFHFIASADIVWFGLGPQAYTNDPCPGSVLARYQCLTLRAGVSSSLEKCQTDFRGWCVIWNNQVARIIESNSIENPSYLHMKIFSKSSLVDFLLLENFTK